MVLADAIVRWEAQAGDQPWLLVVLDACKSARMAELVAAELDNLGGRRRVVLLGTSAQGSTQLGRFSDELDVAATHYLEASRAADHRGIRQLYGARLGEANLATEVSGAADWSVAWTAISRRPLHAVLTGHAGGVMAVAAVPLADGRTLIASGDSEGSLRLWDPATGASVGGQLKAHPGGVRAVTVVPLSDGRHLGRT